MFLTNCHLRAGKFGIKITGEEKAMRPFMRVLGIGFVLPLMFWGCESKQEAAGDAYLKAGDAGNAVSQYEEALQQGKVSDAFYDHYTQAYILLMQTQANADPSAEMLDPLKDSLLSLLKQYPNADNERQASSVMVQVGQKRLTSGDPQSEESGYQFLQAAAALPGKSEDVDAEFAAAKKDYVAAKLQDAEAKLNSAASDPKSTDAIVADYELNQLLLVTGEETPEMQALWSKVRLKNLNAYLYFSAPGLLDEVDARINKYGLLLAIVKYDSASSPLLLGIKVWNASSGPVEFDGTNFTLVDRQGNSYAPVASLKAFKKKAMVEMGQESDVGGLTFKLPKGAEPDYVELKVDDGRVGRKYLP